MTKTMTRWGRRGRASGERDIDDIFETFAPPRAFRREIERLVAADLSPRALWREMDRVLDDFGSPAPLRASLASRFSKDAEDSDSPPPLRRRVARFFQRMFGRGEAEQKELTTGQISERDDAYVVRMDLPGVREEDVDIRIDGNHLLISAERRHERTKRERGHEYTEQMLETFTRAIELPRGADPSRVDADLRNGSLEVHVAKGASARARQIPIHHREGALASREGPRVIDVGSNGLPGRPS
jgi:HSP20 family protein